MKNIDNHIQLSFTQGSTTFDIAVFLVGRLYDVYIRQTTNLSELGEDFEDVTVTHKIVCPYAKTEHAAIHEAGRKIIKGWNREARLGKDHPIS